MLCMLSRAARQEATSCCFPALVSLWCSMVSQKLVGAVAAAGAAVLIPALLLLRKSKGGAQGRSFTLRSSTGIEVSRLQC